MEDLKQKIISVLKEKGSELSTAEIMQLVSKEYKTLKAESKYNEARQLHRKILYHLNMLVKENILRLEKYGANGQKFFIINVGEGEELCEISPSKYKKRLIGDEPLLPAMPIEGYEQQGIVMKYEPSTWIDRLNSVIVRCELVRDQAELDILIKKLFPVVNDCICLEHFESILNKKDSLSFLKKLNKDCIDYGKRISMIVHVSGLQRDSFEKILAEMSKPEVSHLEFIYSFSSTEDNEFAGKIISAYAKNKRTIYIKNEERDKSPWFIGRAGVYNFDEEEWLNGKKPSVVGCSQNSIIVDVRKFYENYGFNIVKFTELLMNISKSFLSVNPIQRKKLRHYFDTNIHSNSPNENEFLELSRNYIRFWNFGLLQPDIEPEKVLDIMEKARKKVDEFSATEDRIFNSCGMPIRFKVVLSPASKRSDEGLSPAKYRKIEVQGLDELKSQKTANEIRKIKKVSALFDGGNPINFHRVGNMDSKELVSEISFILNNYKLRFFSYDFEN